MCVKHRKNHEAMRSDKCKKGGFDSFFLSFLWLTKAGSNGRSNLGMFVPTVGDLGAFLRHILLHVGTFRQMLGLS